MDALMVSYQLMDLEIALMAHPKIKEAARSGVFTLKIKSKNKNRGI